MLYFCMYCISQPEGVPDIDLFWDWGLTEPSLGGGTVRCAAKKGMRFQKQCNCHYHNNVWLKNSFWHFFAFSLSIKSSINYITSFHHSFLDQSVLSPLHFTFTFTSASHDQWTIELGFMVELIECFLRIQRNIGRGQETFCPAPYCPTVSASHDQWTMELRFLVELIECFLRIKLKIG